MDIIAQIDAFFAGKPQEWVLFEALRSALCARWPETRLRVMKTCISFDDPRPYGYVSLPPRALARGLPEGSLLLTFGLREAMIHARFAQVVPVAPGRVTVHMPISSPAEIDGELFGFLQMARYGKEKGIRS